MDTPEEPPKPLNEDEILQIINRHAERAQNRDEGDLSAERQEIFSRYYGKLYGNEKKGRSSFRTREVLEAVEWAIPTLVRAFLGARRAVVFEPQNAEDEDQAEQETDVVNHEVLRANEGDGFEALHNFIKGALMAPTSYLKVIMDKTKETTVEHIGGIPSTELSVFTEDPTIQILEQTSKIVPIPVVVPPDPNNPQAQEPQTSMQPIEFFELRVRRTVDKRSLKIMCVPGEEMLVDRALTSINLDNSSFLCHRRIEYLSDLIEMGFDRAKIEEAGQASDSEGSAWFQERVNRLYRIDEAPDGYSDSHDLDPSMRPIEVRECYLRIDTTGEGVAQRRRILVVGDKIIENEETQYQPLIAMSSLLIPHKHSGLSIAELVMDIQQLLTTLTRQMLDNIYRLNLRKKVISLDSLLEGGLTLNALLNRDAEIVMVRGMAHQSVFPEQAPSILQDVLPIIQDARQATTLRTGINPETSIDPNTLQQSTFGAFTAALEKASERIELVTRCMAETGIKQLFRKVHHLNRMFPDVLKTVKLRGKWVQIDTSEWEERNDVRTNVGLGHHSRQTLVMLLGQFLQKQLEMLPLGLTDLRRIYNALDKFSEVMGLGSVSQYFLDPSDETAKLDAIMPPPPPPDPQAILAEAQAEALKFEQQRLAKADEAKAATDQMKVTVQQNKEEALASIKNMEAGIRERDTALREQMAQFDVQLTEAKTALTKAQAIKTAEETQSGDVKDELTEAQTALTEAQIAKTFVEAETEALEDSGDSEADETMKAAQTGLTIAQTEKTKKEITVMDREPEKTEGGDND